MSLYRVPTGGLAGCEFVWLVEADSPEAAIVQAKDLERAQAQAEIDRILVRFDGVPRGYAKGDVARAQYRIDNLDALWADTVATEVVIPWNGEME